MDNAVVVSGVEDIRRINGNRGKYNKNNFRKSIKELTAKVRILLPYEQSGVLVGRDKILCYDSVVALPHLPGLGNAGCSPALPCGWGPGD